MLRINQNELCVYFTLKTKKLTNYHWKDKHQFVKKIFFSFLFKLEIFISLFLDFFSMSLPCWKNKVFFMKCEKDRGVERIFVIHVNIFDEF